MASFIWDFEPMTSLTFSFQLSYCFVSLHFMKPMRKMNFPRRNYMEIWANCSMMMLTNSFIICLSFWAKGFIGIFFLTALVPCFHILQLTLCLVIGAFCWRFWFFFVGIHKLLYLFPSCRSWLQPCQFYPSSS